MAGLTPAEVGRRIADTYGVRGLLKTLADGRGPADNPAAKLISTIEQAVDREMWTDNSGSYASIVELCGKLIVTELRAELQRK